MTGERRGSRALAASALLFASIGAAGAQSPDHSGTWRLNRGASQIASGVGLAPLGAGGAPPTIYVTQSANGTVVVGSDINESAAQLYRLTQGKGFMADREGVSERFSLSEDGKTLTVTVASGSASSTLVYTRSHAAEPCENWPTPCRW